MTIWQTNGWTYDGLNREVTERRDGVFTIYNRDALGNVTNRAMPNGLVWSASYQPDGRIATEQETGGRRTPGRCLTRIIPQAVPLPACSRP